MPEIDWDYAVIERLNTNDLATSLKPFNLGRALLEKDEKDNLELQPGDIVTIFSQADIHVPQTRQTTFVRLEGEFQAAGVYSVHPGETLRELVERAGGLTKQATSSVPRSHVSPQGGNNKRSWTNTPLIWKGTSNAPQRHDRAPRSMFRKQLPYQASLESQRALAAKLRLMRATGRIVLDIAPGSTDVPTSLTFRSKTATASSCLPDPRTSRWWGQFTTRTHSFYENSRKAEDYLQLAGGIARSGDSRHTFIIRADGSVVSRKSKAARGGLERLSMNPGDTVVVPEIVDKTTLLRGLTDWSAIFGQFALGAAAINVLH